ncbi:hypothetical protein D3C85_1735560 [compost metagenome]
MVWLGPSNSLAQRCNKARLTSTCKPYCSCKTRVSKGSAKSLILIRPAKRVASDRRVACCRLTAASKASRKGSLLVLNQASGWPVGSR